jgi:hypothetical protein
MSQRTYWDEPRPSVFQCHECGERVNPDDLTFESACRTCKTDLHSCRSCSFFDTQAENECRQAIDERIPKKRANNDCALFRPILVVDLMGSGKAVSKQDQAKAAFDELFNF